MQWEGLVAQLGNGRLTRSKVFCAKSNTVKRSLGKGDCEGDCRLNSGCTSPAAAKTGRSSAGINSRNAMDCLKFYWRTSKASRGKRKCPEASSMTLIWQV